ncbi:ubiquitin thioesterase trabid isoform X1 [Musca domestica]|uniref:ubiquitinyl hydrolase 1 n=2 Tax=Musca domestica TaxID=7370 RepID=A0A1I8N6P1_MUSDO|nr:ubiquitin thioesterase trabid isoform X1 [Musca domestica]XP_011292705.1 ubiquitin thioesterase trabid isoform X1 [Musca domestica]XP_011292708.1 ubiquitin thioesterase trabid isoform X1 [Musca domestica]
MCDPVLKKQKWTCDYCTYENFPSAIKCTMCKGVKPMVNEDIFRLSPPQTSYVGNAEAHGAVAEVIDSQPLGLIACSRQDTQNVTDDVVTSTDADCKWSCKMCTYKNWPRSIRCVQCYTKKGATAAETSPSREIGATSVASQRSSPIMAHSAMERDIIDTKSFIDPCPQAEASSNQHQLQERLSKMQIATNIDAEMNASNSAASAAGAAAAAQRLSPIEGSSTIHLNNLANNSSVQTQSTTTCLSSTSSNTQLASYTKKWACNTCTYENFPKSLKCSMCGNPRDSNSSSSATANNSIENNGSAASGGGAVIGNSNNQSSISCSSDKMNDTVSSNNSFNKQQNIYQLGSDTINNCDTMQERQERRIRQIRRQVDWQWLNACLGVVENNYSAVEAYLSCGGNPARSLTSTEIAALNRNSAFDVGHTLIHLAIRFHREEMLPMLLAQISGSGPGIKRVPSYVAPDLASDIRRHFANMLRMRKSMFPCTYVQEHATFVLPAEIEELPLPIQEQLYDELLDRDAQKQLENPPPALNWSLEITARLGSRLMVLWNRSAGDCLLDSAMQATWGVFDRDNILRRALADSLHQCAPIFYSRWKEYEMVQASMLHFTLEEAQWQEDWSTLLSLASQPGASLEQLHIFALAHILRRPIIVYGVKYVKSFRGEDIGFARFEGVYLPLFWDQNFCIKSPIALGYTRGHFSALVPMEPYARIDLRRDEPEDVTYLPLMDCESKLLPIHFLKQSEMGREEAIMRQWLDVCVTEGGLLVAQQKLRKRPLLVAQMLEEWLNHYRRIAQVITAPFVRRHQQIGYSSDGDSDEE